MSKSNNLTCVLLNGPSASGKTQTARGVAAPQGLGLEEIVDQTLVSWDLKALASPLSEMHNIRTDIIGEQQQSRQLWMLHSVLIDLFPKNSVDFTEFVELLYDIEAYPLNLIKNSDGALVRDRDFMTTVADWCHFLYPNVFAESLVRKIWSDFSADYKTFNSNLENYPSLVGPSYYHKIVIVPDLRLEPELEAFEKFGCNLIKIQFHVSDSVQEARMLKRDVNNLTEQQKSHPTQSFKFDDSVFDLVLESDDLSVQNQISITRDFILSKIKSNIGWQNA